VCAAGYAGCCQVPLIYPGSWNQTCVKKASELCVAHVLSRPRVEEERVMVDACIEPKTQGVPRCPLATKTTHGHECCARAMALEGVYRVRDTTIAGSVPYLQGRFVEWYRRLRVKTPSGIGKIVNATLVPDPCVRKATGEEVCHPRAHKLWHAAGAAWGEHGPGPLYPDCPDAACECKNPGARCLSGRPDNRRALTAVASALITTNSTYVIDLRWDDIFQDDLGAAPFTHDPSIERLEARWHARKESWSSLSVAENVSESVEADVWPLSTTRPNYRIHGDPFCYADESPQRAEDVVGDDVPRCQGNYNYDVPGAADWEPVIMSNFDPTWYQPDPTL
jgi:hypothetical protein